MINKIIIFFNIILLVCFFLSLLLLSVSYWLGIILIILIVEIQLGLLFLCNINDLPLIWDENTINNHLIAHCDGRVKSITIVNKFSIINNCKQEYYMIIISNQFPMGHERIAPFSGEITINNNIKNNKKNHEYFQLQATIVNGNKQIIISDRSCANNHNLIDIFPNKYIINDVTELFSINKNVIVGDLLWSMYFFSESCLFIPVKYIKLFIVNNQRIIKKETLIGQWLG